MKIIINEDIIFLTSAPLESYMVRRPHHIAKILCKNNRVINISHTSWRSNIRKNNHSPWRSRVYRRLPFERSKLIQKINRDMYRKFVKRVVTQLKQPPIFFIYGIPNIDLYEELPKKLLVYELTDDIPAYFKDDPPKHKKIQDDIMTMLNMADIVFTVSKPLYKKARKINKNTYLVRNGVDYEYFSRAVKRNLPLPNDMVHIQKPIIGYSGALSSWINFDLIINLAHKLPDMSFVFIGRAGNQCRKAIEVMMREPNIHILGEKSYETVVNYISQYDVAIMPFILDDLGLSINPIKLYEYLAAGKPVISSAMSDIQVYLEKGVVSVAHDIDIWESSIIKMLKYSRNIKFIKKRLDVAKRNSWQRRVSEINEKIYNLLN